MKFITPILKNLMSSKRRTILTVLSIAVSLFIFSALISLPTVNQVLSDTASSVRVATHNKAGGTYPIPQAYKQRIATTPHVVAVVPQRWFGGIYHRSTTSSPIRRLIRNVSTAMTAGGIALVVAVFVIVMAIVAGLGSSITDTGSPDNLVVVQKGSTTETSSEVNPSEFDALKYLSQVQRYRRESARFARASGAAADAAGGRLPATRSWSAASSRSRSGSIKTCTSFRPDVQSRAQ